MRFSPSVHQWGPVFFFAGVIFYFSSFPGQAVPHLFPGSDKVAHFLEYIPFGFFMARALALKSPAAKKADLWLRFFLFALLYALSDEVHQLFVPGREFSPLDIFFDMMGASLGKVFYISWRK
jgi:VanZ family protein